MIAPPRERQSLAAALIKRADEGRQAGLAPNVQRRIAGRLVQTACALAARFAYCPVPGKQRPVAVLQALPGAQSTAVFWQGNAHFWN